MGRIDDIYYKFINSNHTDSEDVKKSGRNVDELIKQFVSEKENAIKISDACSNHAYETEKQGFEAGFRYAMQLAAEVFII